MIPLDTPVGTAVLVVPDRGGTAVVLGKTHSPPWSESRLDAGTTWYVAVDEGCAGKPDTYRLKDVFALPRIAQPAAAQSLSEEQVSALWHLLALLEGVDVSVRGSRVTTFASGVGALKQYLYSAKEST